MKLRSSLSIFCFIFLASFVYADDVEVSARLVVIAKKQKPAILVKTEKKVVSLKLKLIRDDGQKINKNLKNLKINKTYELCFEQKIGTQAYKGDLAVVFIDGQSAKMPIDIEISVLDGNFAIVLDDNNLDLKKNKMTLNVDCPLKSLNIKINGSEGLIDEIEKNYDPPLQKMSKLNLSYNNFAKDTVLQIAVLARCSNELFREHYFYPWEYKVEHDEVNFNTDKHKILKSEIHKLDASYLAVHKAIKKYGKFAKPKLFIGGHTDTVGGRKYNINLSKRRARAIAKFFKSKGLKVDIYYIGFGEEALKVKTADCVDEPQNRRAEYIISMDEPSINTDSKVGSWIKLP